MLYVGFNKCEKKTSKPIAYISFCPGRQYFISNLKYPTTNIDPINIDFVHDISNVTYQRFCSPYFGFYNYSSFKTTLNSSYPHLKVI